MTGRVVVVRVPTLVRVAAPGPQGPAGVAEQIRAPTLTADGALSGHRAVRPTGAGTVEYAENQTAAHAHGPLWVTTAAAADGAPVTAIAYGTVTEPSWTWTAGQPVFLGAGGALTQTAPTAPTAEFLTVVGIATATEALFVNPAPPILL